MAGEAGDKKGRLYIVKLFLQAAFLTLFWFTPKKCQSLFQLPIMV
jgi:hypothetical protein